MCVIVAKKKNIKMPSMETFKQCFNHNSDGAGLMYTDNNEVVIEKGFMTWESFETRLKELNILYNNFEDKSFVAHFRIGTQGENDAHTCHPFPISSKHKFLRKTTMRTDVAMVHNGIINEYSGYSKYSKLHPKDKQLSDTQLFIRYTVNAFKSLNRKFYKNSEVMECLAHITEGSKLCFLDKDDNLYFTGEYVTDDGVLYSNNSYKTYTYSNYTPSFNWKDWYDDDYEYGKSSTPSLLETSYSNPYDEEQLDYVGQYYGELATNDLKEQMIPLTKNDIFYLTDGYLMTITNEDDYWYDEYESILYYIDKQYGCFNQVGFGWIEEGCEV